MRSIYLENIDSQEASNGNVISITGDSARHLIKVIRIKLNEDVLLLNGKGLKVITTVSSIEKKEVGLLVQSSEEEQRKHNIDLALGLPKKEAIEDIIRFAVELGINNLIPLSSKYSQTEIKRNERLDRIVESAMIQSNNPYTLNLAANDNISNIVDISKKYDQVIYFCSRPRVSEELKATQKDKILLVIGPEAGFSDEEEEILGKLENSIAVHLASYILRAPTALCAATGFVLSKFD